jgi:hypothetical protein
LFCVRDYSENPFLRFLSEKKIVTESPTLVVTPKFKKGL